MLASSCEKANLRGVKPKHSLEEASAPAITFRTNVILPGNPSRAYSGIFVRAGDASPFRSIDEVPPRLRPLIGEPPRLPDLADLEAAQQEEIADAFDPVSESVQEELERKSSAAAAAAIAQAEISALQASREDQFVRELQSERDRETEELHPTARKQKL